MAETSMPARPAQGLYDPSFEHDACGVGFVAHIKGHAGGFALLPQQPVPGLLQSQMLLILQEKPQILQSKAPTLPNLRE